MRDIGLLLKKDLMQAFSFSLNFKESMSDKKIRKKLALLLISAIGIGYAIFFVYKIMSSMYDAFQEMGKIDLYYSTMVFALAILLITSTLPYSLSRLYRSKDNEHLLTLPLKASSILKEKIIIISTSSFFYAIIFLLPQAKKLSDNIGLAAGYFAINFVHMFFSALILCSIIAVLSILLMSVTGNNPKVIKAVQFFGMIGIMVLAIAIQAATSKTAAGGSLQIDTNLIDNLGPKIEATLGFFPPLSFMAKSMSTIDFKESLTYTAFNVAIGIATLFIVSKLFTKLWLKGLSNSKSSGSVKANTKTLGSNKTYKRQSIVLSLAKKEFSNIFKEPIYLFNIGLVGLIIPFAVAVPLLMSSDISNLGKGGFASIWPMLSNMQNILALVFVGGSALGAFIGMAGGSASTSITREGKNIWLMQVLPISAKDQVLGRFFAAELMAVLSMLPSILIITFLFKIPFYVSLLALLGGTLTLSLINGYGLFIDIIHPKLTWDSPQQAVKQNLNVFLNMVADIAYIGGIATLATFLFSSNYMSLDNLHLGAIGLFVFNTAATIVLIVLSIRAFSKRVSRYSL